VAGDFEEVYGAVEGNKGGLEVQDGTWDAVLTCFFVDTVRCVFELIGRAY
jgi:carnosine N-methyltransferase